jgi:Ca2+-binding RTX toxin-like protein
MIGRLGNDQYYVRSMSDAVSEGAGGGSDRVFSAVSYSLSPGSEIETLSTTDNFGTVALDLSGNELAQTVAGNDGNNIIDGRGGADTMIGRAGDDQFYVDNPGDTVDGGAGNDRVFAAVSYALTPGSAVEFLSTTDNFGAAALNLTGNAFDQQIGGNAGNNVIAGREGADTLIGLGGQDAFLFNTALDGALDVIMDFVPFDDTVQLDRSIFSALSFGPLAGGAYNTGPGASESDDRIIFDPVTARLLYDPDGTGSAAATAFAYALGNPGFSASDFFVV